jgi:glucose-6-phosphate isomerase
MNELHIDISKALPFVDEKSFQDTLKEVEQQHQVLLNNTGKGNSSIGWLHLPLLDSDVLGKIQQDAQEIRTSSKILIVIGIGGSYLGSRAIIEALDQPFSVLFGNWEKLRVFYAGNNLSSEYLDGLFKVLQQHDYSVVVISKSGTTIEPALAFRLIKKHLEEKYGKDGASKRIIAITDAHKGALKQIAEKEKYKTYSIPDDVGGRFSVLSPVGLLPIAAAGYDIEKLLEGARTMREKLFDITDLKSNPAVIYAAMRNTLYRNGKIIEIMVSYKPRFHFFTEWWKQLFAESEGKDGEGIFPTGVSFTTDLHSLGQIIQEGKRNLFETVISTGKPNVDIEIPSDELDFDGLNYLSGRKISEINKMAKLGTILAHVDGGVPNIQISISNSDEFMLGQLIYFFEFSCALSGYTIGINPFDQPGVEAYKNNMFALLRKPGFEEESDAIAKRMGLED